MQPFDIGEFLLSMSAAIEEREAVFGMHCDILRRCKEKHWDLELAHDFL
jgi:hypothetical protein